MKTESLSEEVIAKIYKQVEDAEEVLDSDVAVISNAEYVVRKVAAIRNKINRMVLLEETLNKMKSQNKWLLSQKELLYETKSDSLLALDEVISKLPSIEDRKAMVGVQLRDLKAEISNLKIDLNVIESVYKVVERRHKELASTMYELKIQISLTKIEIFTGGHHGDNKPEPAEAFPKPKRQASKSRVKQDDEIEDILKDLDG